ncbi:MAG: Ig-like domain-containing protein, partial [Pseudonocardiaceae bacterium]
VAGTVEVWYGCFHVVYLVGLSKGRVAGSTSTLAVGSRSLTAVFTPSAPALFSSSTSPPESFVITASTRATATSTALFTSPASPVRRGTQVALIATITPSTTAGVVQFRDGVINLGNPVVVSNGAASATTSTLAVGGHQLTAVFSPSDPTFAPSTSPVLAFEVTDPGLADLSTCLRVLRNCPNPGVGTTRTSRFDHVDLGIEYLLADRPRNIGSWAGWSR